MLHFKNLGLPLLLSLFSLVKGQECTFSVKSKGICEASSICTSGDNGYYLLESGDLIKYQEDDEGSNSEDDSINECLVQANPIGYYKNKSEYIKCSKAGCETLTPAEVTCDKNNEGKLIKSDGNIGLCTKINKLNSNTIDKENYVIIKFDGDGVDYLVHHKDDSEVFNFDNTAAVYYVVTVSADAIQFNPAFTKTDHCAKSSGELINRKTDFCSTTSSGMYYNCISGLCTAKSQLDATDIETKEACNPSDHNSWKYCTNDGYYNDDDGLYECTSVTDKTTKEKTTTCVEKPKDIGYYKDANGKVIKCQSTKGINKCIPVDLLSTATCSKGKIISEGYKLCIDDEVDQAVEIFEASDKSSTKLIPADLFDDNTGKYYTVSSFATNATVTALDKDKYYYEYSNLILCGKDDALCNSVNDEGYYVVEGDLISCNNAGTCSKINVPSTDGYYINKASEDSKKLIKCTATTTTAKTTKRDTTTYSCSVISNALKNGYYLSGSANIKLIYCDETDCKEISGFSNGFYYNENYDSYVKCSGTCEGITTTTAKCDNNKYEVIIKSNNDLKFCNATTEVNINKNLYYVVTNSLGASINYPTSFISSTTPTSSSSIKEIVLKVDKYSTTQFIDKNAGICINANGTKKSESGSGDKKYVCTDIDKPCEVIDIGACKPNGTSTEQKICSGYYYVENVLYECSATGSCDSKNKEDKNHAFTDTFIGYVKNNVKNDDNKYVKCTTNGATEKPTYSCVGLKDPSTTCSYAGDLIKKNNNIYLCIDGNTDNAVKVFTATSTTDSSLTFIPRKILNSSATNDEYSAVTISENAVIEKGENIGKGNYLFNRKIMECPGEGIVCKPTVKNGYYINTNNNELITCEGGTCSSAKAEGYFTNDKTGFIKCGNTKCESITLNSSCSATGNIYKDSKTKDIMLCVDGTKALPIFKTGVTEKYYIQKNIFDVTASSNAYYVLSVSENTVIPTGSDASGNYLFNDQVMKCTKDKKECSVIADTGYYINTETNNKEIIKCENNKCENAGSLMGYFKKGDDNKDYIKCTSNICGSFSYGSSCTTGNLIKDESALKLCTSTNKDKAITVFIDTNDKYLFQAKNLNTTITDEKKYYLIEVGPYYAEKKETSDDDYGHYLYVKKDDDQKVISGSSPTCPADEVSQTNTIKGYSKIEEYRRDEKDDTYTKE